MQIGRDLACGNFRLLPIRPLPLFEPLQDQNVSISHICETKQSNLGGRGYGLTYSVLFCFFSFSSSRFSVRDFVSSLCVVFSENAVTE